MRVEAEGGTLVTVPRYTLQLNEAFALRRQAMKSEDCDLDSLPDGTHLLQLWNVSCVEQAECE